jgi:hypothetical protein
LDAVTAAAFNEAVPCRRICRRFSPRFAEEHHVALCIQKWKNMMSTVFELQGHRRSLRIHRILQDLARPVNTIVARTKPAFCVQMEAKIREFLSKRHEGADDEPYFTEKWLRMFQRQCVKTLAAYGLMHSAQPS